MQRVTSWNGRWFIRMALLLAVYAAASACNERTSTSDTAEPTEGSPVHTISSSAAISKTDEAEAANGVVDKTRRDLHRIALEVQADNPEPNTDFVNRFFVYGFSAEDRSNLGLRTLLREKSAEEEPISATHALLARGCLGDPEAFAPLVNMLENHTNGYLRAYAADALGRLGDPRAIPYLEKALGDPFVSEQGDIKLPFVHELARGALMKFW